MNKSHQVERIDIHPDNLFYQEHLARYNLAAKFAVTGPVLDLASGSGYGTEQMQMVCKGMSVGMDIDRGSLLQARQRYPQSTVAFLAGSGTAIPFATNTFATITSMETIEHIQNDTDFVKELARVLRPGGICIITTPNRDYSLKHKITNPYHMREYVEKELTALLSAHFEVKQFLYQGFDVSYHQTVDTYAQSIQKGKERLNPVARWLINYVYRPLKKLVPTKVVNYFIRRILNLSYPQPKANEIAILEQPVQDCSNFFVVCQKPVAQVQTV